jgi:hypothetical protein
VIWTPRLCENQRKHDHVMAFIRQDGRLTIRMIADELNINERTVHEIVTQDLKVRKLCAKIVPKNWNDDQQAGRKEVSMEMIERLETEQDLLFFFWTSPSSGILETSFKPFNHFYRYSVSTRFLIVVQIFWNHLCTEN